MTAKIPNDIYAVETQQNNGNAILFVTANKTEDLEFFYPYYRFIEEGYKVDVATPDGGEFKGKQGLGLKETKKISEVNSGDYQLLYIPGGKAPEELKKTEEAVKLTKEFATSGKPIASICHGPQLLAKADVIKGKQIAAWPEVEEELTEAGATYVNQQTCVDGQFITARWPADLPAHIAKTLEFLKQPSSRSKKAAA